MSFQNNNADTIASIEVFKLMNAEPMSTDDKRKLCHKQKRPHRKYCYINFVQNRF